MRSTLLWSLSLLGIIFVLLAALMACIRWYPYPFDFSTYPTLTHTKSVAAGDPINVLFVGSKDQILSSFHQAAAAGFFMSGENEPKPCCEMHVQLPVMMRL